MSTERPSFVQGGVTPPCGWVYEIRHEGETFMFQAPMRLSLMQDLRTWYSRKKLEWPGDAEMAARVEEYICSKSPKHFCKGGADRPHNPVFSIRNIRAATQLFTSLMFKRKDFFVDQEEANRRAHTCANCPHNLHGLCTGCAGSEFQDIFAELIRRGRSTPFDQALDTCRICGCLARAKVHVSMDVLSEMEKHTYPPNCWLFGTPAHKPAEKES